MRKGRALLTKRALKSVLTYLAPAKGVQRAQKDNENAKGGYFDKTQRARNSRVFEYANGVTNLTY